MYKAARRLRLMYVAYRKSLPRLVWGRSSGASLTSLALPRTYFAAYFNCGARANSPALLGQAPQLFAGNSRCSNYLPVIRGKIGAG